MLFLAIGDQYKVGLRESLDRDCDAYMDHMMHLLKALESYSLHFRKVLRLVR